MEKFNEKELRKNLLKEYLVFGNPLIALAGFGPLSIPGFLYNLHQIRKNKKNALRNERAICLISDDLVIEWQNLMLGVKGLTAKFFTQKGVRVDYKHNATSEDLKKVLLDKRYQHIVLQGHGDRNCWDARDGRVYGKDVDGWMKDLPKKSGYFIQFTCGDDKGQAVGYNVVRDKSKILGFTKKANFGDRFEKLWSYSPKGLASLAVLD